MIGIFCLSAQTADESRILSGQTIRVAATVFVPGFQTLSPEQQAFIISGWQNRARKTAHTILYFVLGLLFMSALPQHLLKTKVRFTIALFLSIGYATTDELHQMFVAGRGPQISDIFIDTCGAILGILLVVSAQFAMKCRVQQKK